MSVCISIDFVFIIKLLYEESHRGLTSGLACHQRLSSSTNKHLQLFIHCAILYIHALEERARQWHNQPVCCYLTFTLFYSWEQVLIKPHSTFLFSLKPQHFLRELIFSKSLQSFYCSDEIRPPLSICSKTSQQVLDRLRLSLGLQLTTNIFIICQWFPSLSN